MYNFGGKKNSRNDSNVVERMWTMNVPILPDSHGKILGVPKIVVPQKALKTITLIFRSSEKETRVFI